jgi:PIN domain nuclease of toxin-antitoxin system
MLIAQARMSGLTLVSADEVVAAYGDFVLLVR